jgi:probable HAF family extracellular repeat protein
MQALGTLGGNESWAYGVSADGSIVVGFARDASGLGRAVRWTASGQIQDLNVIFSDLLNGAVLYGAVAISADGRFILGTGVRPASGRTEAFLLYTGGR